MDVGDAAGALEAGVPAALVRDRPLGAIQGAVHALGTTDTVVWNPGPAVSSAPSDLAPDAWKSFVCVEAAVASEPIELAPAQVWIGSQTLRAE